MSRSFVICFRNVRFGLGCFWQIETNASWVVTGIKCTDNMGELNLDLAFGYCSNGGWWFAPPIHVDESSSEMSGGGGVLSPFALLLLGMARLSAGAYKNPRAVKTNKVAAAITRNMGGADFRCGAQWRRRICLDMANLPGQARADHEIRRYAGRKFSRDTEISSALASAKTILTDLPLLPPSHPFGLW